MSTDNLGEQVTLSDLSSDTIKKGELPNPQDPWGTASSVDSEFSPASPASSTKYAAKNSPIPKKKVEVNRRPIPPAPKATKKESAAISRFREVLGISRVKDIPIVVSRRNPNNPSENASIRFGVRALGYEDYQWVLEKTQDLLQTPSLSSFAWKLAYVSMAVASIDNEPVWEAFGFSPASPEDVRDVLYPKIALRFQAAESMLELFRTAFFDVVEEVYKEYTLNVDTNYVAKDDPTPEEEEEANVPLAQSASGH